MRNQLANIFICSGENKKKKKKKKKITKFYVSLEKAVKIFDGKSNSNQINK